MTKTTMALERRADLEAQIRIANRLYYDSPDNSVLPDAEFDALVDELKKSHPDAAVLNERSNYDRDIEHTRLVGSWDKCHSSEEVVQHFAKQPGELLITPKLDGASVTLYYEDGVLQLGATRGDSRTGKGKDITANVLMMEGVPSFIPLGGKVEVKGEAVIHKSNFYGKMDQPGFQGKPEGLANPRNAAAGGMMAKNPYETQERMISFVAYGLEYSGDTAGAPKHSERLEDLGRMGFDVPSFRLSTAANAHDIGALIQETADDPMLDIEIDGVVIVLNNVEAFEAMGVSGICPQGGIAYKFKTEQAETTLLEISWAAQRTGAITPKGRVSPVRLCGTYVEFMTLHNLKWLQDQGVNEGDTVLIEKANEIIPKLVSVVRRTSDSSVTIPTTCPSCDASVEIEGVNLVCRNTDCSAKIAKAIRNMLEKLDIKGIGPKYIEQILEHNLISKPEELFALSCADLRSAGFGAGQAANIVTWLRDVKVTPAQLLASLGIKGWGRRMFTQLFEASEIDYKWLRASRSPRQMIKALEVVPGVGPDRARELQQGLDRHRAMLDRIAKVVCVEAAVAKAVSNTDHAFCGAQICLTGKLGLWSRQQAEQRIQDLGGSAVSGVTAKTDYLVVADPKSKSSKTTKAQKLGTKILSEEEFYVMCG